MKAIVALTSRILVLGLILLCMLPIQNARAQAIDGTLGWEFNSKYYSTAEDACVAQWRWAGMENGYSRFISATPNESNFASAACQWTSYQYLCPDETGGGINRCGTVLPGTVYLACAAGYTPVTQGFCRKDPALEKPCKCEEPGRANPIVGNPVVLATGAKILDAEDFTSADGQFRIGRQYRSFQVGRPLVGTSLPYGQPRGLVGGWNFDFNYEVQLGSFSGSPASPNARVALLAPDGTGFAFVLQSNGQWVADPALGAGNAPTHLKFEFVGTLPADLATIPSASSSWRITDNDDTIWTIVTRVGPNGGNYKRGWATSKVTREGYSWTYTYNTDSSLASVTDSFGRSATFDWNQFYTTSLTTPPAGALPYPLAIAKISLPDGTKLKYTYDPPAAASAPSNSTIKRLVKVERLSASNVVLDSVGYLYEDARFGSHVTGVVDNQSVRIRTYAYDSAGRATLTSGADGNDAYAVEYGVNGTARTRRVTNPLGKATSLTFAAFNASQVDYRLTQTAGEASPTTAASTASLGYGADTFTNSQSDPEGRTVTTSRDARGRTTSIVEASGTALARTTTIGWHSTLNVPATITRPGLTETRSFSANGQLQSVTLTDTTNQSIPYSTNGQSRTWTYSWTPQGRLLSINGPLAADGQGHDDIVSFTYNAQGNLVASTNALGQVTTYGGYDAAGRPGTVTDPNGVTTAYGYDPVGRVQTITIQHPTNPALNAVTTMTYDAVGRVTGIALPSTDTLLMDYDTSGRMIAMRAASGEKWDFAFDKLGNVVGETVRRSDGSRARGIARAFDELGRLISVTRGTLHTSQRYTYDKVGNAVTDTTANGQVTNASFDAFDRVVNTLAPDGGNTTLAWDAKDDLIGHTDPILVTTQFVSNGFGDMIQEVSPDRGTNTYVYDSAGQLSQAIDGRGQVINYSRDWLGRVTAKLPQGRPASEAVTYVWDAGGLAGSYGVGKLAKIVDGTGETLFGYDHRGALVAQRQTIGATASADLAYQYDLAGRITKITYPSGREVRYTRDSKGRVNLIDTRPSASGVWTTLASAIVYEPFGPVGSMALGNGLSVVNSRDDAGQLASRRLYRTASGVNLSMLSYRYDADGNVAAIEDQVTPANTVYYGYDPVGRLNLTVAASGGSAETYSYTTGTNRLATVTTAAGLRSVSYDARGNTASESRPAGVTVMAGYDGYGRLTAYNRSGISALGFAYNGRDDRVAMLQGSDTRRFVYDPQGRVMAEYGNSVLDVKAEFIWLSPAVGDAGAFGGGDGIGGYVPLAVATPDLLGAVQLTWVHGNHLGVPIAISDASGNPATTPNDYLAPGFPGQSKVLPDLYYNRYRDYDPTTGRYVQADPIGLGGGTNNYVYVEGNPVNSKDPLGLTKVNAFNPSDTTFWKIAENEPDMPGWCTVFAHGNAESIKVWNGKKEVYLKDVEAIRTFLGKRKCKPNDPVIFAACNFGAFGNESLPQLFADRYRVMTVAPDKFVFWNHGRFVGVWGAFDVEEGTRRYFQQNVNDPGKWIPFRPRPR